MASKYSSWSLEALWSFIIQPPCGRLPVFKRDTSTYAFETNSLQDESSEPVSAMIEANESALYDVLHEVVVRRDDYPAHMLYPPDARPALLRLLSERHHPSIPLLVCHLLVQMCSSIGGIKEKLTQEGVILILTNLIKSYPIPLSELDEDGIDSSATVACGLPRSSRLIILLLVHVIAWLQSFALGSHLCISKLNECDAAHLLSRLIDGCNPQMFRHGSVNSLESLVTDRVLIARRYAMTESASSSVCYTLFGDAYKSCISLYNGHYLLDLYDTSGADDVHILDELCNRNEIWRYEEIACDADLGQSFEDTEAGSWVDVRVTDVINSSYFWAVLGEDFRLMTDIRKVLDNQSLEELEARPKPGQNVIALKSETRLAYRAQVIALSESSMCHVFAIDYGFVENKEWGDLRKLPSEPKLRISGLAHLCKIMGARQKPISRQLVENILATLCNLTADSTACMHINLT